MNTLFKFRRWEAWLLAGFGIAALVTIQYLNCRANVMPLTWQKLLLSTVCGIVGGIIVWSLQTPLRWWFCLAAFYYYSTVYYKPITGHPWPYNLPGESLYLWLAAGVAGTFLYTRWLLWEYKDYDDSLTMVLCFYGCALGLPILLWGTVCYFRRFLAQRQANADLAAARAEVERQTGRPWQTFLPEGHPQRLAPKNQLPCDPPPDSVRFPRVSR